jgi:hypothetical protein
MQCAQARRTASRLWSGSPSTIGHHGMQRPAAAPALRHVPHVKAQYLGRHHYWVSEDGACRLHTHACCDSNGQEIHYAVPIIRGPANAPLRLREVRTAHCPGNRPALVRVPGDGLGLRLESARTCEAVYIDTATCPSTRSGNMQLL